MPDHDEPERATHKTRRLATDDTEVDAVEVDAVEVDATEATGSTALARQPALNRERDPLERGARVGRYVIIDVLGKGGMGVVFEAYDPELSRRIALKLVRADGHGGDPTNSRDRILREAQALAQLSHPNVVAVYDVGEFEDSVFIAMELVEGNTLRRWRRKHKPSRERIIAVFLAAGRGLAAAHAANIIHRDFKPDNVLIGDDGRVRVADFGLACAAEAGVELGDDNDTDVDQTAVEEGAAGADSELGESTDSALDRSQLPTSGAMLASLTETGLIMGTPRYMAPEQHLGIEVDEHTDEYSFCVTLHEALFDRHPFPARDHAALKAQITLGQVTAAPAGARVPARLRRIVKRGMAVNPDERYPSMGALLADLATDPWVLRRRIGLFVMVLALTLLAVIGLLRDRPAAPAYCTGFDDQLAGVWDRERAAAIERAFLASGRHHAAATSARVDKLFSAYADEWVALSTFSCRATRRGQQSEQLLDLRSACLERLREQLGALTKVFTEKPDGDLVDGAVTAVLRLPPVDSCTDDSTLTRAGKLPSDPQLRARAASLGKQLIRATALNRAGKLKSAMAALGPIVPEARSLGYALHLNSALLCLASLQRKSGDSKAAISTLEELVVLAADAKNDSLVGRVWIELVAVIGTDEERFGDALALRYAAEAAVARSDDDSFVATLHGVFAEILWAQGNLAESRAEHELAIAFREIHRSKHPELARSYNNYGNVLFRERHFDEAEVYYRRALVIWEQALGSAHPEVATALTNLGNVLNARRRAADSVPYYKRAIDLKQASRGPDHPSVATSLSNLGEALKQQKRYAEALVFLERALKIWQGHYGDSHPRVAIALNNIGAVYKDSGDCDKAVDNYQSAEAIFIGSLGTDHPYVAHALTGLGYCYIELGRLDDAVTALERAVTLHGDKGDPLVTAEALFALARALTATGGDRERAVALARRALALLVANGDAEGSAEVESWLDRQASSR